MAAHERRSASLIGVLWRRPECLKRDEVAVEPGACKTSTRAASRSCCRTCGPHRVHEHERAWSTVDDLVVDVELDGAVEHVVRLVVADVSVAGHRTGGSARSMSENRPLVLRPWP